MRRYLKNMPKDDFLWRGLGGNFDSLTQIINEFIDNSLSNFIKHPENEIKQIFVRIEELKEEKYRVVIEDTGTGIKDLDSAFSIGNTSSKESSLNEHGFGMKHALAAANPDNNDWKIVTRTQIDAMNKSYTLIKAPFKLTGQEVFEVTDNQWIGKTNTGTIIEFVVDEHWIKTIVRGLKGRWSRLDSCAEVLSEDLGYTYAYFIKKSIANVQVQYKRFKDKKFSKIEVIGIEPKNSKEIEPGKGNTTIDLGSGEVKLIYEFLTIEESNYNRYYKANIATSGVEIRINGRVLESALFTEIWGIERHNSYNHILIRINIESKHPERLPSTTTTKGNLRRDDPKLEKIFEWIKSKLPYPPKGPSKVSTEKELFKKLAEKKKMRYKDIDSSSIVNTEQTAFHTVNERIKLDLYQSINGITTIYEGKLDKTRPLDVYQLLMYWDGLVLDGMKVDKAILIAAEHPHSVEVMVRIKNQAFDFKSNKYNIELRTWREEGINYPHKEEEAD